MTDEAKARVRLIACVLGVAAAFVVAGYATFPEWAALADALE
jgi:hypothetical protein